ncbi:hypothetical protein DBR46_15840 [Pseudomonas sp. KBW05]|nr:hypothetical protein DBR46_15840 [Pseudomonas sp. KBW05]
MCKSEIVFEPLTASLDPFGPPAGFGFGGFAVGGFGGVGAGGFGFGFGFVFVFGLKKFKNPRVFLVFISSSLAIGY